MRLFLGRGGPNRDWRVEFWNASTPGWETSTITAHQLHLVDGALVFTDIHDSLVRAFSPSGWNEMWPA